MFSMKYQLPFGTYGIRGNANTHPFTPKYLKALGCAIEILLHHKKLPLKILIGADTRASSPRIRNELCAGFSQDIHILDAGIIPTPGVMALIKKHSEFGCGIIITASHNPAQDNGIKIVLQHGNELTAYDQNLIQNFFDIAREAPLQASVLGAEHTPYAAAAREYEIHLKKHFAPRFLAGTSIGLDCANGAVSEYAPAIFEYFGARVMTINASPDGKNINRDCGSNSPSALRNFVLKHKLSCGFAFDGDGDRVVGIDAQGNIKNGDDLLFTLATNPTRKRQGPIVGTTMSNSNLARAIAQLHRPFVAANVGELEVIKTMNTHGANLGGEPSGHIIAREYLMCSDGIFVALATLDAALMTNNMNLVSFHHQPQVLKNVTVTQKVALENPKLTAILEKYQLLLGKNTLLVRYSGTEPMLRILLESETLEQAQTYAHSLAQELIAAINDLATTPQSTTSSHEHAAPR